MASFALVCFDRVLTPKFFSPYCWRSIITVLLAAFLTFPHNFLSNQASSVSSTHKK
jgi:hypothetical protein